MKTKRLLILALGAAVICLLPFFSAEALQKSTPPPKPSQAELEDRVKELEDRQSAAEQKAASAAMEKDYITRVQKQYEAYYEKAFNTQVWILSILGLILTTLFFLAGRFGFGIFDRRIEMALREASAQLRTEFTQMLVKESQALREGNAAQIKELDSTLAARIGDLEKDLKTRSDFQFQFAQGLAAGADERYANARTNFRFALETYKSGKPRQLFEKKSGALTTHNIFVTLKKEDETNFEENAKKELADELYNDLEDELALAAVDLTWLAPLLKERK